MGKLRRLLRRPTPEERIERLYEEQDYLDAYREHIDLRVEQDPQRAPGGMWEALGALQLDFLVGIGLQPHHRLFDLGCGTLRGGRRFIDYLDAGGYCGIDISPKAIDYAKQLVEAEGLAGKRPRLVVNRTGDLRFDGFDAEAFDYVLAQSVFTHLRSEHIEECFRHIGRIMSPGAAFCFTFNAAPEFEQTTVKNFRYPFEFFRSLADEHGFSFEDRSADYGHPRGQRMAVVRKGSAPDR